MAQFSLVVMTPPILLAVPNVSEGRDAKLLGVLADAATGRTPMPAASVSATPAGDGASVRLLDMHSDRDHHRAVFTLAGRQRLLADALLALAAAAVASIDVVARASGGPVQAGAHPHVGASTSCRSSTSTPPRAAPPAPRRWSWPTASPSELGVPVLLYGELAGGHAGRTRAALRSGGVDRARCARRRGLDRARLRPDAGSHASAGATLVAAREPLVAFNLQLRSPATIDDARRIAALIREGGEQGMPGLRAIVVQLAGGVAQVSMNVERPLHLALAEIVERVARLAPLQSAELVGLAPRAALDGFPADLPMPGFDASRHVIEQALSLAPGR